MSLRKNNSLIVISFFELVIKLIFKFIKFESNVRIIIELSLKGKSLKNKFFSDSGNNSFKFSFSLKFELIKKPNILFSTYAQKFQY